MVEKGESFCSEASAFADSQLGKLDSYKNGMEGRIQDLVNRCDSLGEEELQELESDLYSVEEIRGKIVSLKNDVFGYIDSAGSAITSLCSLPDKVKGEVGQISTISDIPCSYATEIPCESLSLDFSDFSAPSIPEDEYITYFGVGEKVTNLYSKVTSTTNEMVKRLGDKADKISSACSDAVNDTLSSCQQLNDTINNINGFIQNMKGEINNFRSAAGSYCGGFQNQIGNGEGALNNLSIPDFDSEGILNMIRNDRSRGCYLLQRKFQRINNVIDSLRGDLEDVKNDFGDRCTNFVKKVSAPYQGLKSRYEDLTSSVSTFLSSKLVNDPERSYL